MTQITVKQMAAAKRVAMNVLPLTNKKAKLQAKIAEMEQEIEALNQQIDVQQGYVKSFAAGLTTEQLVVRNENKVFEPNTDVVYFDEEKRVYVVMEFNAGETIDEALASSAEEIAEVEEASLEAEAEQEVNLTELPAEEINVEEARQEEIRAAKERLSAAQPNSAAKVEIDPFA